MSVIKTTLSGSIPACAGEPALVHLNLLSNVVYPRVCGGTLPHPTGTVCILGLSPRVRGNHPPRCYGARGERSIPACAGEPEVCAVLLFSVAVYPRVCGGTARVPSKSNTTTGLSPRVRGNHCMVAQHYRRTGSIPACAGEPFPDSGTALSSGVYPRVCGGTELLEKVVVDGDGLSPRVRGNLPMLNRWCHRWGSIPACAGEPVALVFAKMKGEVYPRVCGGTVGATHKKAPGYGLSPRVRGNR